MDTMTDPLTPAVREVIDALQAQINELQAMRQRAVTLAATPTLGGAARTQAAAGRYVLGLASLPVEVAR